MLDEPFVAARKRNLKERVSHLESVVENLRSDAESANLLLKTLANSTSTSPSDGADNPKQIPTGMRQRRYGLLL
jgi:hypothetical protein